MELDRPHRSAPSTTSDLFICFTSRLSNSSSMRLSSRSILSPGRSDKPPVSLPTSLSRRLRTNNGSLKGGQSPMFPPVVSKKRGCAFENPEPSSPKVTCIGQVRVKTKKQRKKMKMNMRALRERRSDGGGEVSFRRIEGSAQQSSQVLPKQEVDGCLQNRNQKWVHFPFTICKSSCFSSSEERDKAGRQQERVNSGGGSSCGGAVFRWLVAFHEGEGKTRDIELVVEEAENGGSARIMERDCSRRRSIFDDMDFNVDGICEGKKENGEKGELEGGRVSICVPPKNALLLMRCRSDPVKMSALANKFCESPAKENEADESDEECFHEVGDKVLVEEVEERRSSVREDEKIEAFLNLAEDGEDQKWPEEKEESPESTAPAIEEDSAGTEMFNELTEEEKKQHRCSIESQDEVFLDLALFFGEVDGEEEEEAQPAEAGQSPAQLESTPSMVHQEEGEEEEEDNVRTQQTVVEKDCAFGQSGDDDQEQPLEEQAEEEKQEEGEEDPAQSRSKQESPISDLVGETQFEKPREDDAMEEGSDKEEEEEEPPLLPDCLLLMMCEPKLSTEVSKETWVCSTDFIRGLPERHRQHQLKKINGGEDANKKKNKKSRAAAVESIPPLHPTAAALLPAAQKPPGFQPPRSSCSFPVMGGVSMASLIEKKLVNAVAYEPFVLTRCKSEPMRSATAKFAAAQELACFWKNRKMEPHRRATCGVGAAGVGA